MNAGLCAQKNYLKLMNGEGSGVTSGIDATPQVGRVFQERKHPDQLKRRLIASWDEIASNLSRRAIVYQRVRGRGALR